METDIRKYLSDDEMYEIAINAYESIYRSMVASGELDPTDKSLEEIIREVASAIKITHSKDELIPMVENHSDKILGEAENQLESENYNFSCLLYATWIEHWINYLILDIGAKQGLNKDEIKSIIRDKNIRSKYSWIIKLLQLPPIEQKYYSMIINITEYRNAFVHHKFNFLPDDFHINEQKKRDFLKNFSDCIKYLQNYYNINVLRGKPNFKSFTK